MQVIAQRGQPCNAISLHIPTHLANPSPYPTACPLELQASMSHSHSKWDRNPRDILKGWSLYMFAPDNRFRVLCARVSCSFLCTFLEHCAWMHLGFGGLYSWMHMEGVEEALWLDDALLAP